MWQVDELGDDYQVVDDYIRDPLTSTDSVFSNPEYELNFPAYDPTFKQPRGFNENANNNAGVINSRYNYSNYPKYGYENYDRNRENRNYEERGGKWEHIQRHQPYRGGGFRRNWERFTQHTARVPKRNTQGNQDQSEDRRFGKQDQMNARTHQGGRTYRGRWYDVDKHQRVNPHSFGNRYPPHNTYDRYNNNYIHYNHNKPHQHNPYPYPDYEGRYNNPGSIRTNHGNRLDPRPYISKAPTQKDKPLREDVNTTKAPEMPRLDLIKRLTFLTHKLVQIEHHLKNWERNPKTIDRDIGILVDSICLPCPQDKSYKMVSDLKVETMGLISQRCRDYLTQLSSKMLIQIAELNIPPEDWHDLGQRIIENILNFRNNNYKRSDIIKTLNSLNSNRETPAQANTERSLPQRTTNNRQQISNTIRTLEPEIEVIEVLKTLPEAAGNNNYMTGGLEHIGETADRHTSIRRDNRTTLPSIFRERTDSRKRSVRSPQTEGNPKKKDKKNRKYKSTPRDSDVESSSDSSESFVFNNVTTIENTNINRNSKDNGPEVEVSPAASVGLISPKHDGPLTISNNSQIITKHGTNYKTDTNAKRTLGLFNDFTGDLYSDDEWTLPPDCETVLITDDSFGRWSNRDVVTISVDYQDSLLDNTLDRILKRIEKHDKIQYIGLNIGYNLVHRVLEAEAKNNESQRKGSINVALREKIVESIQNWFYKLNDKIVKMQKHLLIFKLLEDNLESSLFNELVQKYNELGRLLDNWVDCSETETFYDPISGEIHSETRDKLGRSFLEGIAKVKHFLAV